MRSANIANSNENFFGEAMPAIAAWVVRKQMAVEQELYAEAVRAARRLRPGS
jgi:hypothetical protein